MLQKQGYKKQGSNISLHFIKSIALNSIIHPPQPEKREVKPLFFIKNLTLVSITH